MRPNNCNSTMSISSLDGVALKGRPLEVPFSPLLIRFSSHSKREKENSKHPAQDSDTEQSEPSEARGRLKGSTKINPLLERDTGCVLSQ